MFGSVVFVLIGLWLLISPPEISNPILGNKTVIFISGIAALLFFGTTAAISLKKIMQRIPGLIISKEGIYDNSSAITIGLIKWEDLVDIGVVEVQKQKLLMISKDCSVVYQLFALMVKTHLTAIRRRYSN